MGALMKSVLLAFLAIVLALGLILFPEEAFQASLKGLDTWWRVVFPSLLPFFIISELLIGFGVVHFLGILLEPLMRPLFRVPGIGGFVWAMGMASGNPAGPKLAARMREERAISRMEAERLAAFTSSANPLFIFGAVAVGFFHNPRLGVLLAAAHYGANIAVGLIMRYYGTWEKGEKKGRPLTAKNPFRFLHEKRIEDGRPLGRLLGDAVVQSVQTLLMIGGFIIFFSVINRLLTVTYISGWAAKIAGTVFPLLSLDEDLSEPFISGLFEMTIGIQGISEKAAPLLDQAVVASFLLAFGGFSIQAQVSSILARSDIRFLPFFCARLLQGILASWLTVLLWRPVYEEASAIPAVARPFAEEQARWGHFLSEIGPPVTIIALSVYTFVFLKRSVRTND